MLHYLTKRITSAFRCKEVEFLDVASMERRDTNVIEPLSVFDQEKLEIEDGLVIGVSGSIEGDQLHWTEFMSLRSNIGYQIRLFAFVSGFMF